MSCLQNEMLLESIFEEVQEAFPYLDEAKQIEIAQNRFDDLCQQLHFGGYSMEFNQKELEHLLNCLNFYYSESDHKEFIMEVNSTLCKKIDEQLILHRRAF